jgi:ParB family transcriptional regulator, chromosome partitioning protein
MSSVDINLVDIHLAPGRPRAIRGDLVERLAESMKMQGLLQPITVRPRSEGGYLLVFGGHRLKAAELLGWAAIEATITDTDGDKAELAGIDENLIRGQLSPAERALHIARRKELYEKLHPETRHGGAPGRAGGGKKAKDAKLAAFAEATAEATGQSRRKVERDATRAKQIKKVLRDVVGTSLDKGDQLDALGRLPESEQEVLASAAKAGEKVSAKEYVKKSSCEGTAVSAKDTGLREFNGHLLRLVQTTRGHKPERFAKTSVRASDLSQLARFLEKVAAASEALTAERAGQLCDVEQEPHAGDLEGVS